MKAEQLLNSNFQDSAALTFEIIKSGTDIIYQAVFFNASWRGNADFLIKCDTPSGLGDFSYEVLDTNLAHSAEPKHIIQLCVYSQLLGKLQDLHPVNMHLFLGDGKKYSFCVADFFYYYTRFKARFENYIQNLLAKSYTYPCSHCNFCQWSDSCKAQWEADNQLSLVANIHHSQMDKLRNAKIQTVADLATTSPDTKIHDISHDVFMRLRS